MTDQSTLPPPGGPASSCTAVARPGPDEGPALLAAVLVIAGSVVVGLAGGLIWAAVAPRVQYQVYTLHPPTAYATNPETSAFIAADGWYCFIALAGGALIGLLAYLLAIRRYGPLPMAGAVIGSIVAAFIAEWLGHQASGGPGFSRVLATSKPGTYLHAPIALGSHGALAFWPLAAAAVAGGIELVGVLRTRHQVPYGAVPMPGMDSFRTRPYPEQGPDSDQSQPSSGQWPGGPLTADRQAESPNGWPSGLPSVSPWPTQYGTNGAGLPGGSQSPGGDPGQPGQ